MPQDAPNISSSSGNQPNNTPAIDVFANQPSNYKKSRNNLIPITIILAILALAGIGISIFFGIQNANLTSKISQLEAEVDNLTNKNSRPYLEGNSSQDTTKEPQTPDSQTPSTPESETRYFEPEGWDVKFAYPEGVTEVNQTSVNYGDELLLIDSITYNGKTYDVDICNRSSYNRQYPFLLGQISRWNNNSSSIPSYYILIFEQGSMGYYYWSHGGNGCADGDNADYNLAVELTSQLLHNITAK